MKCEKALNRTLFALNCFIILSLSGCTSMNIDEFKDTKPVFRPEEYFQGCLYGTGGFFNRWGTLKRRFYLTVKGVVEQGVITLDEDLLYDNGENKKRVYTIRPVSGHEGKSYTVDAEGMVGMGTIRAEGNALNWNYVLRQEVKNRTWDLTFDDWMFLQHDQSILNRAQVSKFGIDVGHVILHFERKEDSFCESPIVELVKLEPAQ